MLDKLLGKIKEKKHSNEKKVSEEEVNYFIKQMFQEGLKNIPEDRVFVKESKFLEEFNKEVKDQISRDINSIINNNKRHKIQEITSLILSEFKRLNKIYLEKELYDYSDLTHTHNLGVNFVFYYDETNNIRVLRLKNDCFNSSIDEYFVLGGVCGEEISFNTINLLFDSLKLQPNIKKVKAKHIFNGEQDFVGYLKSDKIEIILNWIKSNNIFIHYISVDNLQVIAFDIIRRLINLKDDENLIYSNLLYDCMKQDIASVCRLLNEFNYPQDNIQKKEEFIKRWVYLINKIKKNDRRSVKNNDTGLNKLTINLKYDCLSEKLMEGLKTVSSNENQENEKDIVVYTCYYEMRPILFINSTHIFDKEDRVENEIKDYKININGKELKNFQFERSLDYKTLQLSDIIVSMLGKFFEFINELGSGDDFWCNMSKIIENLNNTQKDNFLLFIKILKSSYSFNSDLFLSTSPILHKNRLKTIIDIIDFAENGITISGRNRE